MVVRLVDTASGYPATPREDLWVCRCGRPRRHRQRKERRRAARRVTGTVPGDGRLEMRTALRVLAVIGVGLVAAVPASAQVEPKPPAADTAVRKACAAAGGLEAFNKLGIVGIACKSEEVTQDGHVTDTLKKFYFLAPGPVPGRLELPQANVVAADDGTGGWAVIAGKPDQRLDSSMMVKRSLRAALFPLLLPFSLTWEGVSIARVSAGTVEGRPVWKLSVELPRTFFDTPQISTSWTVALDRTTFAVVQAESPYTDLGKGVTADGMLFRWNNPIKVGGVTFYPEQRVTGLDEFGREKSHSRIDRCQYHLMPADDAAKMFGNPIPPDQRPKPPAMQPPPAGPPATPQG